VSPAARPARTFGSDLGRRVATAVVVLPALLAGILLGPAWLRVGVVVVATGLGLLEFFALLQARDIVALRAPGVAAAAMFFTDASHPALVGVPLWPVGLLLLSAAALGRSSDVRASIPALAGTLLGAAYLGVFGGCLGGLARLSPAGDGGRLLVLLLAIVMVSDALAFFVGHAVGRRRLAPRISPGKTVEGAAGGLLGGALGALAVRTWLVPEIGPWAALGLGAVAAALGIAGDLFESLLKRWAGVKDSGGLFPGHGGMLDRLDSLLFAAPALYALALLGRL